MGNCCGGSDAGNVQQNQIDSKQPKHQPLVNVKPIEKAEKSTEKNNSAKKDEDFDTFCQEALAAHNELRKKHHVEPLVLDKELVKSAQRWADVMAKNNNLEHSDCNVNGKDVGENIAYTGGFALTAKGMTQMWYDEVNDYNYKNPESGSKPTGHFTQVVWKGSKTVGFGKAKNGNSYYGCAQYYPAGNYEGEYKQNVLPQ
jgi:uncharacterized protein YkwD